MLFKKILKRIKSLFGCSMYYSEKYGWYNIVYIKRRTDYCKTDALIVTDNGIWYKVPYIWLIENSIDKNGYTVKPNKKWV